VAAIPDVELAHRAAFAGGPGVLVIGGTGSIAIARDRRGRARRAGGWGQLLGDEGSGFWIGRAALHDPVLRAKLRLDPLALAHLAAPVRAVSAVAPRVLRLARTSARARRIRDEAARHLADLAIEACRGLDWGRQVPVSWWGGLFQDPGLRACFASHLRRGCRRALLRAPSMPAEAAAAVLGIDRASPAG
jgi:N-acetylglucosamine kinase-like BadF-type ATPase